MVKEFYIPCISILVLCLGCYSDQPEEIDGKKIPNEISYNFHIRPLLADRCYNCHGPDEAAREGDLRLDIEDEVLNYRSEGSKPILVRSNPKKSILWKRIISEEEESVMPPPKSKLFLNNYEKALIKKWIEQGEQFEKHWAFSPISHPEIPLIKNQQDDMPIDAFVKKKLGEINLNPSGLADPYTLIRRVTLDLTGLPPMPEDVERFVKNPSLENYTHWVDHLLSTDAYAEHMTLGWLDVSRYADSQGLHSDGYRSMWPWRDWVINAFKENLPFDKFIIDQLAGDLLPNPSNKQLIATGFNRNHPTTAEGGIVDQEYMMEYAHDRVITTGTAFLGMTMECARCHDHKYDPVSMRDYYQLFAFFNQVDEVGLTGDDGNSGPNLLLPNDKSKLTLDSIKNEIQKRKNSLDKIRAGIDLSTTEISSKKIKSQLNKDLQIYLSLSKIGSGQVDSRSDTYAAEGVETLQSARGSVAFFNSDFEYINIRDVGLFDFHQSFSGAIWVHPSERRTTQQLVGNSGPKGVFWRGWDFILDSLNRPLLRLIHALPHDHLVVRSTNQIPVKKWSHLAFTYDGSGKAGGVSIFIDGIKQKTAVDRDQLQRSIYPISFNKEKSNTPLRLGRSYRAFTGEYGIFEGMLDDFYLYRRVLSTLEIRHLSETQLDASTFSEQEKREWYLSHNPHPVEAEIDVLEKRCFDILDSAPEVMVMQDVKEQRPTNILIRGNYNQPGDLVQPGTPEAILSFPDSLPKNRLGFAKWLVHPKNPLTSRVIANRLWQHFFGRGIVATPHDFGMQGQLPTHPELLDYLASQLAESGWNIKFLIKEIVTSHTYRQSSQADSIKQKKDPENIFLSRGPTMRLTAEMLRDQALAATTAFNSSVGGPSVKPWQPRGLWREKTSSTHILREYFPDSASARYRRSIYTFVRRTSMHPAMEIFDAPTRSVCTVKRQETNTPLQALVLLNDPQFVEISRLLAEDLLAKNENAEKSVEEAYFRLCGKPISKKTKSDLLKLYVEEKSRFESEIDAANTFVKIGQYPPPKNIEAPKLASLTLIINSIMNLDEFYMKR